ncbi:MAG: N-acetylmuramoyl-L-alanine amidase [bacterium]
MGGIIALIVLGCSNLGEPTDFEGYTVDQSVMLGTGITAENKAEVAEKIGKHIRTYAGNDNEFFKEIEASGITGEEEVNRAVGEAFIDSGYLETGISGGEEVKADNKVYAQGNLTGKVIALEAGHGETSNNNTHPCGGGAPGEAAINQETVIKLKTLFEADGATVVLTRETDCSDREGIPAERNGRRENLRQRAEKANNAGADIALDIHHLETTAQGGSLVIVGPCDPNFDSYDVDEFRGSCDERFDEFSGSALANIVLTKMSEFYGENPNRPKRGGNYDFLRYARMPTVIIEATTSNDLRIDTSKEAQKLYEAVHEYFETNPTQQLEEDQELGVNIGLILAIAKVETEYTKPETAWRCSGCKSVQNAFNAQDEDGGLLEYSNWLEGVRAQGKYIYYTYGENGQNTVTDIAETRGEGEAWASEVRSEMTNLFGEIPELSLGGFYGSGDIIQKALEYVCANRKPHEENKPCGPDIKGGKGTIPYLWGSAGSGIGTQAVVNVGLDCSGFVSRVLREALPEKFSFGYHNSTLGFADFINKPDNPNFQVVADYTNWRQIVDEGLLIPGDIIIYGDKKSDGSFNSDTKDNHAVIYVGINSEGQYYAIESTNKDGYNGPQQDTKGDTFDYRSGNVYIILRVKN